MSADTGKWRWPPSCHLIKQICVWEELCTLHLSLWKPWYCLWRGRLELKKTPKIHPSPLPSPVHGLHNVLYILFYFESSLQVHHPGLKDMRMEMPYSASASVVIQMHPHPHALRHLFHLWESPDTCSLHLLSAKACQRSWIGCSHLGPSCTSCLLSLKDK